MIIEGRVALTLPSRDRFRYFIYKLYRKVRNFRGTFAGIITIASFCSNVCG